MLSEILKDMTNASEIIMTAVWEVDGGLMDWTVAGLRVISRDSSSCT